MMIYMFVKLMTAFCTVYHNHYTKQDYNMTLPASGIYKITNLLNGKVYVGQSQNVFERKIQHFTALRNGNHENREMQKD